MTRGGGAGLVTGGCGEGALGGATLITGAWGGGPTLVIEPTGAEERFGVTLGCGLCERGRGLSRFVGLADSERGGTLPMCTPAIRPTISAWLSSGTGDGPLRGNGIIRPEGELPRSRLMLDLTPIGGCGRLRLGPNAPRSRERTDEMVSLRSRRACTAAFRGTEGGRLTIDRTGLTGGREGEGGTGDVPLRGGGAGEGGTGVVELRGGGAGETDRGGGAGDTDRGGGTGDTGRPYCCGIGGTGGVGTPC